MRSDKVKQTKRILLDALKMSMGVVSQACDSAKVDRSTFYRYYNADKKFRAEAEECTERALDFAESKLLNRINEGSDSSIHFYLKTKGRKRGYGDRTELILGAEDEAGMPTAISIKVVHTMNSPNNPNADILVQNVGKDS